MTTVQEAVPNLIPTLDATPRQAPKKVEAGVKLRGADKVARIPVKIIPTDELPKKPDWIRVRIPVSPEVDRIKQLLRKHKLHSVCEEASCPNLGECFSGGTATFMIMGDICTRRCPFCDVGHGRPKPLDLDEPKNLAVAIADLRLKYVVITSVDRDDLRDGGAQHFADCIREIRALSPGVQLETLVPDYRGRMDVALAITAQEPPDVFNHNLETVPRLYKAARPGSDYDCRCNVSFTRTPSPGSPRKVTRWASRTSPPARWCVLRITLTSKLTKPRSSSEPKAELRMPMHAERRHRHFYLCHLRCKEPR